MNARVYRSARDWRGQRVNADLEQDYIGDVTGLVMGGPSVQPLARFPNTVSTEGQIGIPWAQKSGVVVEQHDRLLIDGTLYAVTSDRLWTDVSVLTGSQPTYYWVETSSTT